MMFGIEDTPLLSHAMIAAVQRLADGHVALGSGRVDPEKFDRAFATNPGTDLRGAPEPRFRL